MNERFLQNSLIIITASLLMIFIYSWYLEERIYEQEELAFQLELSSEQAGNSLVTETSKSHRKKNNALFDKQREIFIQENPPKMDQDIANVGEYIDIDENETALDEFEYTETINIGDILDVDTVSIAQEEFGGTINIGDFIEANEIE